jgi:hypothetical protein
MPKSTRKAPVRTEPHPTRSFALPAPGSRVNLRYKSGLGAGPLGRMISAQHKRNPGLSSVAILSITIDNTSVTIVSLTSAMRVGAERNKRVLCSERIKANGSLRGRSLPGVVIGKPPVLDGSARDQMVCHIPNSRAKKRRNAQSGPWPQGQKTASDPAVNSASLDRRSARSPIRKMGEISAFCVT